MDRLHYEEMCTALDRLEHNGSLINKEIYLFGHCNATEELVNLLLERGYQPLGILDNNIDKQGMVCKGIPIVAPEKLMSVQQEETIVCIVARAYAAMADQLSRMGYKGCVRKLIDYNSYAEYSLTDDTISRMEKRVANGIVRLQAMMQKYPDYFKIFCPFQALGDVYFMMSYLPYFLQKRQQRKCVVFVIGRACGQVVNIFTPNQEMQLGDNTEGNIECQLETLFQKDMDELIQAALYTRDVNCFIPHQDRPYVVNLSRILYIKKVSLERIYCCGVFGLPATTKPIEPSGFELYSELEEIPEGRAVIISPYAKSVIALPDYIWEQIVSYYQSQGMSCFTNVAPGELPLAGTTAICAKIGEMKSIVERAGIFIGIRSGLCDVLRTAKAEKIALYPDYYYSDTKWKAIDIYSIEGWENIEVKDGFEWKRR